MIPLEPESTYHIYNRANGSEKIFLNEGNYLFFLDKYQIHIGPIADSLCYCLMPNHFHFLIRIKTEEEIGKHFGSSLNKFDSVEKFVSKQFSNLFSSYCQAFNKQQSRKGSLFMKNFKRKKVDDIKYLRKLVHYIHHNPMEAGLSRKLVDWKFSSYHHLINNDLTFLFRSEVIDWFEDKENFIYCHNAIPEEIGI